MCRNVSREPVDPNIETEKLIKIFLKDRKKVLEQRKQLKEKKNEIEFLHESIAKLKSQLAEKTKLLEKKRGNLITKETEDISTRSTNQIKEIKDESRFSWQRSLSDVGFEEHHEEIDTRPRSMSRSDFKDSFQKAKNFWNSLKHK